VRSNKRRDCADERAFRQSSRPRAAESMLVLSSPGTGANFIFLLSSLNLRSIVFAEVSTEHFFQMLDSYFELL